MLPCYTSLPILPIRLLTLFLLESFRASSYIGRSEDLRSFACSPSDLNPRRYLRLRANARRTIDAERSEILSPISIGQFVSRSLLSVLIFCLISSTHKSMIEWARVG